MPPRLPDGDPAPSDGALPAGTRDAADGRPFGVYLHVPFCRVRCGYCDFTTYALRELGSATQQAVELRGFADLVLAELDLAAGVLGTDPPEVATVFVGGGTPTLLPGTELVRLLRGIRERWQVAGDAEVTVEANPDTVTPALADMLAAAGVTRLSLGMQSAVPHVLRTLDRTHDPAAVAPAVAAARAAGLQVSLDLIYGTPGESRHDWEASLDAALGLHPDHVSAYALTVEDGTKLAAQVRRGQLRPPDDDELADRYEAAEAVLAAAGHAWYEVSNWARSPQARCRHNLAYWTGGDWWGAGPGAHSHVGGVRWWNVKHPAAYRDRVRAGRSPAAAREVLSPTQRADERVLLGVRLSDGLAVTDLEDPAGDLGPVLAHLVADGLVDGATLVADRRIRLTLRGRLLADHVVRQLTSRSDTG